VSVINKGMGKSSFTSFLKNQDGFAKNVSLTYKRQGSFGTSIGGICSIFTFTLLTYWMAINIWDTFAPPGKFNTKRQTVLAKISQDGLYDPLDVPMSSLFVTYKITTSNAEISAAGNINDYVVGLWFQQTGETLQAY